LVLVVVVVVVMYWAQHHEFISKTIPFNSKKDLLAGCLDGFSSSPKKKHHY